MENLQKNKTRDDYERDLFVIYLERYVGQYLDFDVFYKYARETGRFDKELGYSWKDIEKND